ncbi:hypothetical protein H8356DRAFT_1334609 [Neocallimastix lanati (nom. inval.)]|nr:hypothetical protein H8356DRAFT_1334609 [Neocallimastix sp. JGI-2020a]
MSIAKHKIKDEITKSSIPLGIKPKPIYNEQLPPDVTKFDEIPNESKYYKALRKGNFMIFKNPNFIIFHFQFQAKLFLKYNEDIFADDPYYT